VYVQAVDLAGDYAEAGDATHDQVQAAEQTTEQRRRRLEGRVVVVEVESWRSVPSMTSARHREKCWRWNSTTARDYERPREEIVEEEGS
jgi:hypothetical protein